MSCISHTALHIRFLHIVGLVAERAHLICEARRSAKTLYVRPCGWCMTFYIHDSSFSVLKMSIKKKNLWKKTKRDWVGKGYASCWSHPGLNRGPYGYWSYALTNWAIGPHGIKKSALFKSIPHRYLGLNRTLYVKSRVVCCKSGLVAEYIVAIDVSHGSTTMYSAIVPIFVWSPCGNFFRFFALPTAIIFYWGRGVPSCLVGAVASPPTSGLWPRAAARGQPVGLVSPFELGATQYQSIMCKKISVQLHQWSSGRIHRCHRCDPGSIPRWCTTF